MIRKSFVWVFMVIIALAATLAGPVAQASEESVVIPVHLTGSQNSMTAASVQVVGAGAITGLVQWNPNVVSGSITVALYAPGNPTPVATVTGDTRPLTLTYDITALTNPGGDVYTFKIVNTTPKSDYDFDGQITVTFPAVPNLKAYLPDLIVTDVSVNSQGYAITKIKNIGGSDPPEIHAYLSVYEDDNLDPSYTHSGISLKPGEEVTVKTFALITPGTHKVRVTLNPYHLFQEQRMDNNSKVVTVTVPAPVTQPSADFTKGFPVVK